MAPGRADDALRPRRAVNRRAVGFGALVLHLLGLPFLTLPAASMTETGFLNRTVSRGGHTYRYQVYVPADYRPGKPWPLLLFLHGAGERGSDGLHQTQVGVGAALRNHADRFPGLVVMPQAPADSSWLGEPAAAALEAVDASLREFDVDPSRIYLTGLSMGGYGAWHLAYQRPGFFAALVPVCGGILPQPTTSSVRLAPETTGVADPYAVVAGRVAGIPAWLFHGADDPVIPASESRRMVAALRAAGAAPRYTEYPGVGHGAWDPAYDDTVLWTWLLAQRRVTKTPR